jgi:hypothetical protein
MSNGFQSVVSDYNSYNYTLFLGSASFFKKYFVGGCSHQAVWVQLIYPVGTSAAALTRRTTTNTAGD